MDFDIQDDDTVMDLGGQKDTFSVLAGSKAVNGKVYAFEPAKENFAVLCSNIELNGLKNVIAENIALSNKNGTRIFYLNSPEEGKTVGYETGDILLFKAKKETKKLAKLSWKYVPMASMPITACSVF